MFGPRITRVDPDGSTHTVAEVRGGPNGAALQLAGSDPDGTALTLSDDTDRRLTASAGYDSCVQFHWPSAWWTKPSSPSRPSTACRSSCPNVSSAWNGSSKAAHLM